MTCNHPQFVSFPKLEAREHDKTGTATWVLRCVCIGCGQVRLVDRSGSIEVFKDTGEVVMVKAHGNYNPGKTETE